MSKWWNDIVIGVVVLSIMGAILFTLDNRYTALQERQAQAEPSVLAACMDIAAHVQGTYYGTVKERCLMKFDRRYAARNTTSGS